MLLHPIVEEWDVDLRSGDPLGFPGYADKLESADGESVRTGRCANYVVLESNFEMFGGSMGVVHGEKVVRAVDRAIALRLPVVAVTRSGGARMQEGMVSLIQMGRTAAAMGRHHDAGLLSVAVLRSPTTGGVFVSYGSLCDLIGAEQDATVGFAGPRVAEMMTGVPIDGTSHTAERAFAAGLIDTVGDEEHLRRWVEGCLGISDVPLATRPALDRRTPRESANLTGGNAWTKVLEARRQDRPGGIDVAAGLCDSWTELRGDDPVVRAGLATLAGRRVVVVAHDRFVGTGRPSPGGFRLAQRAFALAGRLGLPIVTLIDTTGAEPGAAAELDGLAHEIANTFLALESAPVPTIGVCVGEGGSGGALAFGVTDQLLVQQHAFFSVIGPEGAAMILYRDGSRAPEVAEHLALTSADLLGLGIVDAVIPDGLEETGAAIVAALDTAQVGERLRRFDAASARWIRTGP